MPDPLTVLALKTLLSVAQSYTGAASAPTTPPQAIAAPQSLGDAGETVLHCYHPTGRFLDAKAVQKPWPGAKAFKAPSSVLLQLDWKGSAIGMRHSSLVALMERDGKLKTVLVQNGTMVPANPRCQLEQWTPVER